MEQFNTANFYLLCDKLGQSDPHLKSIIDLYGYPPIWTRPNTFETLVLTILEQQVSLASAYAAYKKLKEKLPEVTPSGLLLLTDEALRACYFSRQKIVYARELANAILTLKIDLKGFEEKDDETIRTELIALKGIGNWTVDIYLLHALQRTDIFPLGDVALVNAVRMITGKDMTKEEIALLGEKWRPYRSVATMILWHYYIKEKKIVLQH